MQYQVNKKENVYFIIKVIVSILILFLIVLSVPKILAYRNSTTIVTIVTFVLYLLIIITAVRLA